MWYVILEIFKKYLFFYILEIIKHFFLQFHASKDIIYIKTYNYFSFFNYLKLKILKFNQKHLFFFINKQLWEF